MMITMRKASLCVLKILFCVNSLTQHVRNGPSNNTVQNCILRHGYVSAIEHTTHALCQNITLEFITGYYTIIVEEVI
jgi:hypothetical protein